MAYSSGNESRMNQVENANKKFQETGRVEDNQKHLLEDGLMDILQKQINDIE